MLVVPKDRQELLAWVQAEQPNVNALINNAGIQRRIAPAQDDGSWEERLAEIEINFHGPMYLSTIFIPYLLSKTEQTVILANMSSGLAFIPFFAGPVYAATKAAIHSYTMGMRYSLQDTNVKVVEIVPPAIKTNLDSSHDCGDEVDEYVAATIDRLQAGEEEIGFNLSEKARLADRAMLNELMHTLAKNMQVEKFPATNADDASP